MTETTEHRVNAPLLRKVLDHVTAHPEEWDQQTWVCGTTACVAGWAVLMSGRDVYEDPDGVMVVAGSASTHPQLADHFMSAVNGDAHVGEFAEVELGLSRDQANDLFAGSRSLRALWTLASRYTHGEITVPADLPGGAA